MSEPIQSISQGNYILQGTVATSAGIVGDGTTQNPLRADETVLWEGVMSGALPKEITLSEAPSAFSKVEYHMGGGYRTVVTTEGIATNIQVFSPYVGGGSTRIYALMFTVDQANKKVTLPSNSCLGFTIAGNAVSNFSNSTAANVGEVQLTKVVGINRKAQ